MQLTILNFAWLKFNVLDKAALQPRPGRFQPSPFSAACGQPKERDRASDRAREREREKEICDLF